MCTVSLNLINMYEYSTNSDSESPSEVSDRLEERTTLGQEYTGFEMPHDQIKKTAEINEAHQKLDFQKAPSLPRKTKKILTAYQRSALEEIFKENKFVSSNDRSKLSTELGLSRLQVRIWFQNRRSKLKRENGKSLSQEHVERSRLTDVKVKNMEIDNRLSRHSAVDDPTRNTGDGKVLILENLEINPHHVFNEFTPQDGPKGEGTSNHRHFVNDNFLGQNSQVLPQTTSMVRTFGGHCYQYNMFQEQYEQVCPIRLAHDRPRGVVPYQNINAPVVPAVSFPQQVPPMRVAQEEPRGIVSYQDNNFPFVPAVSFPQQVRPMRLAQDGPRGVVPYQNNPPFIPAVSFPQQVRPMRLAQDGPRGVVPYQNNPPFIPAVSFPQQVRPMRLAQDGPRGVVPYQNNPPFIPAVSFPQQVRPMRLAQDGPRGVVPYQNNPPFIPAVSFPQQVRPMRLAQDGPRCVVPYQDNNPPFIPAVSFPQQVRPMRLAQDGPRGVVPYQDNNPPFIPAVSFPQQVRPMRVTQDGSRGIVLAPVASVPQVSPQNQRQRG